MVENLLSWTNSIQEEPLAGFFVFFGPKIWHGMLSTGIPLDNGYKVVENVMHKGKYGSHILVTLGIGTIFPLAIGFEVKGFWGICISGKACAGRVSLEIPQNPRRVVSYNSWS